MENEQNNTNEGFRITGDQIVGFLRKLFRAGYSRNIVFRDEDNRRLFGINLFFFALIVFLLPMVGFLLLLAIIVMNWSLNIHKRQ